MPVPHGGSTATGSSSRRSSASSASVPFATPPTSPKLANLPLTRIPKPASSSTLSSSASSARNGKGRSMSASAAGSNGTAATWRDTKGRLPPSPAVRVPSEFKPGESSAHAGTLSSSMSTKNVGLGVLGVSKIPTSTSAHAQQQTIVPGSTPASLSAPGPPVTTPPQQEAAMARTRSAEEAASIKPSVTAGTSAGPRRQRSASSIPRRAHNHASPRTPVPAIPPGIKSSPHTPSIAVSHPTPPRSLSSRLPLGPVSHRSSSLSPTARKPEAFHASRFERSSDSPSTTDVSDDAARARRDRRAPRTNGVAVRQGSSAGSSAPGSRVASRHASPAGAASSPSPQQQSTARQHKPDSRVRSTSATPGRSRRQRSRASSTSPTKASTPRAPTPRTPSRAPQKALPSPPKDVDPLPSPPKQLEPFSSPPKSLSPALPQPSTTHRRPSPSRPPPPLPRDADGEPPDTFQASTSGSSLSSTMTAAPSAFAGPSSKSARGSDASSATAGKTPTSSPRRRAKTLTSPRTSPTPIPPPDFTMPPPPPPMSRRRVSMPPTAHDGNAPSGPMPPIPAKSPLRGLSTGGAGSRASRSLATSPVPPPSPPPPVPPLPEEVPAPMLLSVPELPAAVVASPSTAPPAIPTADRSPAMAHSPSIAPRISPSASSRAFSTDTIHESPAEMIFPSLASGAPMMDSPVDERSRSITPNPAPQLTSMSLPGLGADTPSDIQTPSSDYFPSRYSQDSAPPSAPASSVNLWAIAGAHNDSLSELSSPVSDSDVERERTDLQETLIDSALWAAQKRASATRPSGFLQPPPRESSRALADVTEVSWGTAGTGEEPVTPVTGSFERKTLPGVPANSPRTPAHDARRSPTMPFASPANGSAAGSPKFPRSQTGPVAAGGLQPAPVLASRPHSMLVTTSAPQSPSPSPLLSRRAHLIREIAHTERTHATDLALIRDAYLGVQLRPGSHHSGNTSTSLFSAASWGDSSHTTTPVGESKHSRRSSTYGMPEDGKRTSGYENRGSGHERRQSSHEWLHTLSTSNGSSTPGMKSPQEYLTHHNGSSIDSVYAGSSAAASTTSITTPSPLMASPRIPSTPSSMNGLGRMGPPVGRPLAPADMKAVFLNIAQLAQISDELATAFENALGSPEDEVASPGGEGGSDRLGDVFNRMLPRLRPLYAYYCSRQSHASQRLMELQGDASHAAHLNDCWSRVKSHTHAWNLDSMLIKPIQRVTKYPLLFEDLLTSTTPVHPDYYAIRAAAQGAKALALEIDDAKRRKDLISSVMGKSSSTVSLVKDNKGSGGGGRLLNLRRFKKDKSSGDSGLMVISPYAQTQLKDLVKRLEDDQRNVRRLGTEMLEWCHASKVAVRHEMDVNLDFLKWYSLGRRVTNDPRIERVAAFQGVMDSILVATWEEANNQVCGSVMLTLNKLLDAAKNPLMIIDRLNRKSSDYARYVAHKQAKKRVEPALLQEATDYVALHTQLLEELPIFLEGHTRIAHMACDAFLSAQTRFYGTMRDKFALYAAQYLPVPVTQKAEGNRIKEEPMEIKTGRDIFHAFHGSWQDRDMLMRRLQCVGGDGIGTESITFPSHIRKLSTTRPVSRPPSRPSSRSDCRSGMMSPPLLQTPSLHSSSSGRRRSTSLMGPPQMTSADQKLDAAARVAGLFRRNSHRVSGSTSSSANSTPAPSRSNSHLHMRKPSRSKTASRSTFASDRSVDSERHSFGLPRIQMGSDQFSLSNFSLTASPTYTPREDNPTAPTFSRELAYHDGTRYNALGLEEPKAPISPTTKMSTSTKILPAAFTPAPPAAPPAAPSPMPPAAPPAPELDVGETWRESPVLYACAAVADFSPVELGNQKFKGLYFLPLVAGDLVDVFHEIGRVAELTDFPYSQVGVENDGAVVCRAESGMIGVAMCSFLEPLRV